MISNSTIDKEYKITNNYKSFLEIFSEVPEIGEILEKSKSVEEAREKLFEFCKELEWKVRSGNIKFKNEIDRWLSLKSIEIFLNIISKHNEKLSGFSTLEYLWKAYKGYEDVLKEIEEGFIEEFRHLFMAMTGKANYSLGFLGERLLDEGVEFIDFSKIKGREAGIARSNFLDKVYEIMREYISKYPSGLDKRIILKRKKNKEILEDFFGITDDEWFNYKWQFKNVIKGKKGLEILKELREETNFKISDEDLELIEECIKNGIPFGITPYYLHLFDFENPYVEDLPVRRQVIPPKWYVKKMIEHKEDRSTFFDFMGEHDTSPCDLITRRYVTIAIIKPYESCPQICVYCQRNWMVQDFDEKAFKGWDKVEKALDWFAEHESMIEILITGGDPFSLSDKAIERMLNRISEMDHVIGVRFGTRTIVTVPMRITDELVEILGNYKKSLMISTHVESCYEITPEVKEAVKKLGEKNIKVYNQHVFHKYVSRRFENVALRISLKKAGIIPYYTFYPKGKIEHKDYLVPIARVVQEVKEEARLLPGSFRTDEPIFNVPRMGKNHLRGWQDRELIAIKPNGSRVYLMHPWEKGIYPTKLYTYEDVPIKEYLDSLKEIGENIEEYKTIWYYY
ncbi:KamA family radical SAM protein [Methanocaldococcus sp.]